MTTQRLLQGLWFAVDEVIHHDDIEVWRLQNAIARGNSHHENAGRVKCDSQERKPSATARCGKQGSARQQGPVSSKIFELPAMVVVHVREHRAESLDDRRSCSSRYEEQVLRDGAT